MCAGHAQACLLCTHAKCAGSGAQRTLRSKELFLLAVVLVPSVDAAKTCIGVAPACLKNLRAAHTAGMICALSAATALFIIRQSSPVR
jgi:hypothetical protein